MMNQASDIHHAISIVVSYEYNLFKRFLPIMGM